ncbi:putative disease resistance protein At5g66900 [Castanea sativa]|uniref:putative disease resistance protein At5g66900 n=1 Tax=Castanea sativa TaxID=21020 RepID=UPI003F64E5C3
MAGALVAGGVVGAAFGEVFATLHETVKHVVGHIIMFKSILKRLESTLDAISPQVQEIREFSKALDRPEKETKSLIEEMEKGKELILKCSKIKRWSWNYCFKAYSYSIKLKKLNNAIEKFCQIDLTVQNTRTGLETLTKVNQITTAVLDTGAKVDLVLEEVTKQNSESWKKKKFGTRTLSCAVSRPRDYFVGLELPLKELKKRLSNKEESLLLLTALGGCGKTTLVKMLCWDEEIKGIYGENIFFVNVSQSPNLKAMVQKLFKHNGEECPEFQSDEEAIDQLEQLLNEIGQQQPILLILDDVWPGSESLIEKFQFKIPDYKIVVTSRTAFPRFPYRYNLNPLNRVDAMSLFCYSASLQDRDESSYIPEEYIEKFVSGCGGLPIALKVIGGSLRGHLAGFWLSTLTKWSEGHSMFDSDAEVLNCLRKSLEFSADKTILKEYFMDLGSFPEDQRISATALIDMWTELHEPSENDVHAIANLHELHYRNLASLVMTRKDATEIDDCCNEDFITQHDVLRDLAIHLSNQEPVLQRKRLIVDISGNKLPKWWTEQKQQLINARLLSISTDEFFSSSWCNIQAPEVEALVLNFQTRNYALPEFVEQMVKLKVIVVTNYGFFPAELSNFQLLRSLPNLKRIRLEKVSIPSLCNTLVLLRNLKKLSLFMCNIGHAFGNSTIQVSDSLPNLMEINIDYCNDLVELPGWLCEVLPLKKLRITNCHKLPLLPERIGNLTNLEVLRLSSCTELSELPGSIRSLHKLSILDISDCLSICKLPKHIGELHSLTKFYMKECFKLRNQLPSSIMDLQQLELVVCDEERAKLWEPFKEFLSNLKVKVAKKDINLNWLPK